MIGNLFLDCDGVLADFDRHHEEVFGFRADPKGKDVDWAEVRKIDGFFLKMQPMSDMQELLDAVMHLKPTIITGTPPEVTSAASDKRKWANQYVPGVEVICCRSSEKSRYAKPGDVIVDDKEKYKKLWTKVGGIWVTHTSAKETIKQLTAIGMIK